MRPSVSSPIQRRIATMAAADAANRAPKQLLHLVFGGELKSLADIEFANLDQLDIVGMYPNYAEATKPGRPSRRRPWTMRRCATSSSTSTACSTQLPRLRVLDAPDVADRPHRRGPSSGGFRTHDLIGTCRSETRISDPESLGQELQIAAQDASPVRARRAGAGHAAALCRRLDVAALAQGPGRAAVHRGARGHHRRLSAHHQAFLRFADEGRQRRSALGDRRHHRRHQPCAACSSTCIR